MTVLDSHAVLALLRDEPAAADIIPLLRSNADASLTALGVAEVVDHLVRITGVDADAAVLDLAQLGLADPDPIDGQVALRAGLLRARHYRRRHCEVSMADCVAAETARSRQVPVATADPDLLNTCHAEHIDTIVLPDSAGRHWQPPET